MATEVVPVTGVPADVAERPARAATEALEAPVTRNRTDVVVAAAAAVAEIVVEVAAAVEVSRARLVPRRPPPLPPPNNYHDQHLSIDTQLS